MRMKFGKLMTWRTPTFWLLACCALLLLACDTAPAPAAISTESSPTTPSAYPRPAGSAYPLSPNPIPATTAVPPADVPEPVTGKAALSGILYSVRVKYVLPDTMFYLKRLAATPSSVLPVLSGPEEGDYQSKTDPKGYVRLNDVPPGDYYFAVWDAYSWVPAIKSPSDGALLPIHLDANQRLNLGIINVPWP